MFRSAKTFANYINYVRVGCDLMHVNSAATKDPLVKRATVAITKRGNFICQQPRFICKEVLAKLINHCLKSESTAEAMLYVAAYAFLLRVPSEGLPMRRGDVGIAAPCQEHKSVLHKVDGEVVLLLSSQKNQPQGSRIVPKCSCNFSPDACPVHVLWPYFARLPVGHQPFANLSLNAVLVGLRNRLALLGVADAACYRSHDFRRGHARDLQARGASLFEILEAGEWRSPAFLKYLNVCELERDVALQAHLDDSSGDEG